MQSCSAWTKSPWRMKMNRECKINIFPFTYQQSSRAVPIICSALVRKAVKSTDHRDGTLENINYRSKKANNSLSFFFFFFFNIFLPIWRSIALYIREHPEFLEKDSQLLWKRPKPPLSRRSRATARPVTSGRQGCRELDDIPKILSYETLLDLHFNEAREKEALVNFRGDIPRRRIMCDTTMA